MIMSRCLVVVLCVVAAVMCEEPEVKPFQPPSRPEGDVYIAESFSDGEEVWSRWVKSEATKDGADADVAKYDGKRNLVSFTNPSLTVYV